MEGVPEGAGRRPDAFLEATAISKTFGGTKALDGLTLSVRRGEIHGLVGANGSGKSTLVKILAGVVHADRGGRIRVGSFLRSTEDFHDPGAARSVGLRFVHQDPCVFPELSVAENFALGSGYETTAMCRIRWRTLRRRSAAVLARFELDIDPAMPMRALRSADRTMVAVASALQDVDDVEEAVLVLDEPTAVLPETDVQLLFDALRRCAARGHTIVVVNHRLREVLALADRVTALRDGREVATWDAAALDEASLAEIIVGRRVDASAPESRSTVAEHAAPGTPPVLEVKGLRGLAVNGVDLRVGTGEIVGVAGLRGDGHTELLRMLFGDLQSIAGHVRLAGTPVRFGHPEDAMAAGVAYLPADRIGEALFPELSVQANLLAASVPAHWRRLRLSRAAERATADALIGALRVTLSSLDDPVSDLSGGNQQKVVFGRWLQREPCLLLLDEPSQGVDVGAHFEIEGLVRAAAGHGTAVLVVSSDLGELARLCNRVVIMRSGTIVDHVEHPTEAELVRRTLRASAAA